MSTPAQTIQSALIVNAPAPVTVKSPDTAALVKTYTEEILPLESYTISNAAEYVQAKRHWETAKNFSVSIETLFKEACETAHKAHKALTNLRSQLKAPADNIVDKIGKEILRFEAEENRKRAEEERRLAQIAREKWEAEQAAIRAEQQRIEAERITALAAIPAWEREEETEAELLPILPPPPPPVRLESTIPQVVGGPRTVDKPWEAKVTDPVALLTWVLEKPEDRIPVYIEFRMPALHSKAREFGKDISRVIPGVTAERNQTLKRS